MASSEITDKRILARELHRRGTTFQAEIDRMVVDLPDLASRVAPAPASVETLRDELVAEHTARSARIEQSLARHAGRTADDLDPEAD